MKILLSIFILLIPSFLSGEMVCKSLSGCRIVWETGEVDPKSRTVILMS